jgi:hypothetical protein
MKSHLLVAPLFIRLRGDKPVIKTGVPPLEVLEDLEKAP